MKCYMYMRNKSILKSLKHYFNLKYKFLTGDCANMMFIQCLPKVPLKVSYEVVLFYCFSFFFFSFKKIGGETLGKHCIIFVSEKFKTCLPCLFCTVVHKN